jgi:hypothetical protein
MAFYDSTKSGLTAATIPLTAPAVNWTAAGMQFYGAPVVEHNNSVFTTRGAFPGTPSELDPEIVSLSLVDGAENWAITLPVTTAHIPGYDVPSSAMRMSYVLGITSQSKIICSRGPKSYPDYIYALDGTDGSIVWTSEIATNMGPTGENPHSGILLCVNGDIVCHEYIGPATSNIVRLSGDDGTVVWRNDTENLRTSPSSQIAEHPTDGTIFVANVGLAYEDGTFNKGGTRIYALNPTTGLIAQSYFVGHFYNGRNDNDGSAWGPGDLCVTADSISLMSFWTLGGICPNKIYHLSWTDRNTPISLNWAMSMDFWTGYKTRHFRDVDGNVAFMALGPANQSGSKQSNTGAANFATVGDVPLLPSGEDEIPQLERFVHTTIRNKDGLEVDQYPCGLLRTPDIYGLDFTGLRMVSDNDGTKLIHSKSGLDNRIQVFIPGRKTAKWTIQGPGGNTILSDWSEICVANDNSILVNGGGHVTCYKVGATGDGPPVDTFSP